MCGITGFVNLDGRAADRALLGSMNEAIRHRGPDEDGYYLKGRAGLAMRRLAIIDLAGGQQPIANEDRTA
jgi:asparagine synthase (glutamine-hydrolysing)